MTPGLRRRSSQHRTDEVRHRIYLAALLLAVGVVTLGIGLLQA